MTRDEIERLRARIAAHIVGTADFDRRDRLCPAHFVVFGTNPLSLAYGAGGIALFLHDALGELPAGFRAWLLERRVEADAYPPGLLVGMAGIAHCLFEVGLEERAEEVMAECYRSPLLFDDPTMFLGAAGWGLESLEFHRRTGRQGYLDRADQAVDFLLRTARAEGDGSFWLRAGDEAVHHGYGYGAAGVALFLLQAGLALGRGDALAAARRGLGFELDNRVESPSGWTWPDRRGGVLALPYWGHGSAGVGAVAIRFYEALGEARDLEAAETIAEGAFCRWSILPSLVEGLSGIAEFFVDLHRATGRPEPLEQARVMADTLEWYVVERPEGVTFPGRWLTKVSNDYATGSAGIGLFLGRLLDPARRRQAVDLTPAPAARFVPLAAGAAAALGAPALAS